MNTTKIGLQVLRYGLAIVFMYFGVSQVLDAASWVGLIPEWAPGILFLSAETIVFLNGVFEIVCAVLLIGGVLVRQMAGLLAVHLAIITFLVGFNPAGVRDFGLMMAMIALALFHAKGNHA